MKITFDWGKMHVQVETLENETIGMVLSKLERTIGDDYLDWKIGFNNKASDGSITWTNNTWDGTGTTMQGFNFLNPVDTTLTGGIT